MTTNVFAQIIAGKIAVDKVFENERILAFKDIHPVAPVHILIIPKKEIADLQSVQVEDLPLISEIVQVAQLLAKTHHLTEGYRLLTNNGSLAGQTVFHLHFHLIGGRKLETLG
ncbi:MULTISPECIES: HIT domain-containing protein [unclassified Neochlamydia]|uniref:HIT domain-containing protein n=1 Tax=unclassified Neochlamydia TaxID=2643326 RepID=UPI001BC97D35|nr:MULTISPECIES: HIT domain-containing protein [unclassified Neochlamydia]